MTKQYSIGDSKTSGRRSAALFTRLLPAATITFGSNITTPYLQQSRVRNSVIPYLYIPAEQCALLQHPRPKHEPSCHTKMMLALHLPVGENVQSRSSLYDLLLQPQNASDKKLHHTVSHQTVYIFVSRVLCIRQIQLINKKKSATFEIR